MTASPDRAGLPQCVCHLHGGEVGPWTCPAHGQVYPEFASPDRAGLREALAEEVAEWRRLQQNAQQTEGRSKRDRDADEGYAAGLGRAIFAVDELLAATGDSEGPERFDRSWSHYADDCPTPPGAAARLPYDKPDHAAREGVPEGDLG